MSVAHPDERSVDGAVTFRLLSQVVSHVHTILGAGGAVGNALAPILIERGEAVRLVGRAPAPLANAATVVADLLDERQTIDAVAGSQIVYLTAGLTYSAAVWATAWPRMMDNVILACERANARLLFFDNCYVYGPVEGPMTEETPLRPSGKKGTIRAGVAGQLTAAIASGRIEALIGRSADFYGPTAKRNGVANLLVFENLAARKPAQVLVDAAFPHSYTYIPDAARALDALARRDDAFGQTWHLPTSAPALTGAEFVAATAAALGAPNRITILHPWMIRAIGIVDRQVGEIHEMLYQNDRPYRFDSSKFERAFDIAPTPYETGIAQTAAVYGTAI